MSAFDDLRALDFGEADAALLADHFEEADVSALAGEDHGAVLLVARPEHDPVPGLRERAGGVRLPGDG